MSTNEQANTHGAVQALLPWFANETLPAGEMALVREHLRDCAECREDAALQRRLRAAEPALPPGLDPERALARLMPLLEPQTELQPEVQMYAQPNAQPDSRLDPQRNSQQHPQPDRQVNARPVRQPATPAGGWRHLLAARWRALWSGGGWMPWALAGQGVLIAGLVFQLMPGDAGDYRALSNGGNAAPPPPGNVVVMFQSSAQLGQVQDILQAQGARVVDGPTVTGAYVLEVPEASQDRVLSALKTYPLVQLAEPLNARRAP